MKHSEAVLHLRVLMGGLQKARSILQEADTASRVTHDMYPWVYGDKGRQTLAVLDHVLNRVECGQAVTPLEFYNFIIVLDRFQLPVTIQRLMEGHVFPEPDIAWLAGWEEE